MNQQAVPSSNNSAAIAGIVAVSLVAIGFLCWLLFVHQAVSTAKGQFDFLLPLEGVFNGASAIALIVGLRQIKRRNITAHRNAMLTAFVFSSLFLICYIVHHALHGDQMFAGHGAIRVIYLAILISHIVLSAVALPLILITFFFALTGRFGAHRKLAPVTYPIWLYVSVTGVVVYAMLAAWR